MSERVLIELKDGQIIPLTRSDVRSITHQKPSGQIDRYVQPAPAPIRQYHPLQAKHHSSGYEWVTVACVFGVAIVVLTFLGCAFMSSMAAMFNAAKPAPVENHTTIIKLF